MSGKKKVIHLADPRGFCAGVRRALDIVEKALEEHNSPVYVFHEIVHNEYIIESLQKRGVIFVESLSEIKHPERPLIFCAHGVPKTIEEQAASMGGVVIDATCPLVKKIHQKAARLEQDGYSLILIGHRKHPEVIGTLGQTNAPAQVVESIDDVARLEIKDSSRVAYLTQTTLSQDETSEIVEALKKRFPLLEGDGDICYATRDRQAAIKRLAADCELIFVIGSQKSSNSRRLVEIAQKEGTECYLIRDADEIDEKALVNVMNIGVTAAASAPEELVEKVVDKLKERL